MWWQGINGAVLLPFALLWALHVVWAILRSPSYDDMGGR